MNLPRRIPNLALQLSLCAVALLAMGACDGDGSDVASGAVATTPSTPNSAASASSSPSERPSESPSESPSENSDPTGPTESSASPTTSQSPKPRLLAYAGGESPGVQVHRRADVRNLHGAPAAFKQFIARTAERLAKESTCDDAAVGVTVETLRTDGYAIGGVNDCGGYAAMWAVVDGRWKEIQGTQDSWECRILHRYHVPSDVAGTSCYNYKTGKAHHYSQA
jgi:hypothetical protein